MNICVAGKNDIAVDVLEYLIKVNNERYELCVICNALRKELKGVQKSLSKCAKRNGIPEVTLEDTYEKDDLVFLSMEYDRIIFPEKFKNARLYNIHFSYLPEYKGMYTSAIPLLNGAKYTGVTFHRIDSGIDTGEIVARRKFDIEKKDTCRDLYMKYIEEGTRIVIENLEDVINGCDRSYRQPAEGASYYSIGYIDYRNLRLNLNDVAVSVERQVRAYSFREYQMPSYAGHAVMSCTITDDRSCYKPGTVVYEDDDMLKVSTIDYDVILYKDKYDDSSESREGINE